MTLGCHIKSKWRFFTSLFIGTNIYGQKNALRYAHNAVSTHIQAPFYETIWFAILVVFVVLSITALLVYLFHRMQLQRVAITESIRNHIANDLHDDIGSSLSSIVLMSELGRKRPQQAGDYLTQIGETAQKIIESMNDIVWAVNPDNDTLDQIIIRMQQFAGSLLEKKNIALHFDVASLVPSLKLGMEERKNFYLIFKETIHNAVKYADCSIVKVTIDSNDKAINLKIEDNGKGFDTAKTYVGNGMHNLQKRAKEINGVLEVASLPGCGTSMLLRVVPTQRDA